MRRRVELQAGDILVYKDRELDMSVLEAVVEPTKRLLWAFIENDCGDIQAVAYSEEHVIWMAEKDILRPEEVEI